MKEWANQSNTKIALEESEKVGRKVLSRSNFHPTQNFLIQRDFQFFFANFAIGGTDSKFHPTWEKCYVG